MDNIYKVSNCKTTKVVVAPTSQMAMDLFYRSTAWVNLHNESQNTMYEIHAELIFEYVIIDEDDGGI